MPEYRIHWEIDITAATPLEAAQRALRIHHDSESIATVFDVTDEAGNTQRIDLQFAVQKLNSALTAFGAGTWSDSALTAGIPDGKSATMPTHSIEIIVLYPFLEQHGANVKALDAIDAELRRLDIQTTFDAGAGMLMHRGCLLSLDAIKRRPKLRNAISESGVRYFLIGADTLPLEG